MTLFQKLRSFARTLRSKGKSFSDKFDRFLEKVEQLDSQKEKPVLERDKKAA